MQEKILETKACIQCSENFDITQADTEFYKKVSPSFGGEKYLIPNPTLCPNCRQQRRMVWRNDRKLYKRKCDATGKNIISMYNPESPFRVYDLDFWWSDAWTLEDSLSHFDFDKNFFPQFRSLLESVPKRALVKGTGSENCDYTNLLGASRDGYFVFNGTNTERCLYTDGVSDIDMCVDCSQIRDSSLCYQCVDVIQCHQCSYIQDCQSCSESSYLLNCTGCSDCFACVNLSNKKHHIFNEQYSPKAYQKKKQEILDSGFHQKDFQEFSLKFPRKNLNNSNSENITGDMIHNSQNIFQGFEVYDAENVRYAVNVYRGAHDCMDANVCVNKSHMLYEMSLANKNCYRMFFSHDCWNNCENLLYCTECKLAKDCFGCTGLIGKQYCILNKQYTKFEYEELVPKIIEHMKTTGEWGEFFPASISPFGYNETVAQEYFPLSKAEAQSQNFNWSNYEAPLPKVDKIIPARKLPKNISDIPNDILNWAIECEITKKPFRIIRQELEFYRKHDLPIPKRHPDQRHLDRMKLRNPRKLFTRNCDKCNTEMQTSYTPESPERVYCEKCYNAEIS